MSIWDKYKVNDLPEEQRGEVIKTIVNEEEQTKRARLNSSYHNTVRGLAIGALLLATIPAGYVAYYWSESWKEVKVKSMTPMVCPPPPPCSAGPLPAWDIKVTPVPAPVSSK